jgi:acyl-CoA thioester hydrolase
MEFDFKIEDKVRDYELDIQGVVNNAAYFNYCEHARHEFLLHKGIDFAELARQNINLMVVEVNGKYRLPLTSGDRYHSCIRLEPEGRARFAFVQEIYRSSDDKLAFSARVIGVALNERGRPFLPKALAAILSELS